MKNKLQLLLIAIIILSSRSAFAEDFLYNDLIYSIRSDGTAALIGRQHNAASVVIPSIAYHEYDTYNPYTGQYVHHIDPYVVISISGTPVTGGVIGAFASDTLLQNVSIPPTVTSIHGAFSGCTALKQINLPDNVQTIGQETFSGCDHLEKIVVGTGFKNASVPWGWVASSGSVKELVWKAIHADTRLYPFPSSLEKVTICDGVEYIPQSFLYNAAALKEITIPSTVVDIATSAFSGCSGLIDLVIPNSVKTISPSAFSNCSGIKTLVLSESLAVIDKNVFSGCSELENLFFKKSIKSIEETAFSYCSNIKELILPDSLESVGRLAFNNCGGIESLTFPASMKSIGYRAFNYCPAIKNIYCHMKDPRLVSYDENNGAFSSSIKPVCVVHVPKGTIPLYRSVQLWNDFTNIVDDIDNEIVSGDLDDNGMVDVEDVNAAINIALKLSSVDDYSGDGDMDGNGIIDVEDVNAIINIILKL